MNSRKRVAALAGAMALTFALVGSASASVVWATPDGHYASTAGDKSNDGPFWDAYFQLDAGSCTKIDGADLTLNADGSVTLDAAWGHVVVKQASTAAVTYDNTIFNDVAAGETVFADTDGDGTYGEGDSHGISHIIVCDPATTTSTVTTSTSTQTLTTSTSSSTSSSTSTSTSTSSSSETTSFSQSVSGTTDAPSEPNTASVEGGSNAGNSAWLLIAMLGVVAGSAVVLKPSRVKNDR